MERRSLKPWILGAILGSALGYGAGKIHNYLTKNQPGRTIVVNAVLQPESFCIDQIVLEELYSIHRKEITDIVRQLDRGEDISKLQKEYQGNRELLARAVLLRRLRSEGPTTIFRSMFPGPREKYGNIPSLEDSPFIVDEKTGEISKKDICWGDLYPIGQVDALVHFTSMDPIKAHKKEPLEVYIANYVPR